MPYLRSTDRTEFVPLPSNAKVVLSWPTDNHSLFTDAAAFFARTRVNPDYGRPGWTRDCGQRFHRGCDIAPAHQTSDGKQHRVMFSDCARNVEFASEEPGWIPADTVYAVHGGVVVELNPHAEQSTLGRYVIIEHRWHDWSPAFYSLSAHLEEIAVPLGKVVTSGERIGRMGQTSSSADARIWMAIAPHLHLEFWDDAGESYNPEEFLRQFLPKE